jgi:hypothetical protein
MATTAKCSPTQLAMVPVDGPGGNMMPAWDPTEAYYLLRAAASEAMDTKAAAAFPQALPPPPPSGGTDMWPLIPSCRIVAIGGVAP